RDELNARNRTTTADMPARNMDNTDNIQDPARLEQEIEETRRDMAETLDTIQERLDPQRIKSEAERRIEDAVGRAKDEVEDATIGRVRDMTDKATYKAKSWRSNLVNTIKDNPVPAALVGVGLGWLIMEGSGEDGGYRSSRRYDEYVYDSDYDYGNYSRSDYGDYRSSDVPYEGRYRGTVEGTGQEDIRDRVEGATDEARQRAESLRREASERIDRMTEDVRSRAESWRDEATDEMHQLRDEARQRTRELETRARREGQQVQRSMKHMMRENPLAVGAAALALGVVVGWTLPATDTENRLVGEYRDDFVEQARSEAENVARKAQSAAKEAFEDVKEETKSAAKQAADEVSQEGKRATDRMTNS
ncbi:MAG TPA: DUF3618 domain-containing protein, partial [Candidatus Binatia bacterium]|nr:DUF3618 domain-containing protein [Candidatus Binatia bacterium]